MRIHFTPHLRAFFDLPDAWETSAGTLREAVRALDAQWPGLAFYITDEQEVLRQHVAIWVDGKRLPRSAGLDGPLSEDAVVHIMQALSGG